MTEKSVSALQAFAFRTAPPTGFSRAAASGRSTRGRQAQPPLRPNLPQSSMGGGAQMTFGSDFGRRAAWWAAPVLLILTGIAMTVWTWQTWADVTIDFGREVYVPWQLTEGKILYRDIAYFGGPLSPGVNYLWFKLFGVSIQTLVFCNLAILTGLVCLAGYLLSRVASRLATTGACLVLLIGFAFGQPNYNFVCPYSHDITHGIVLALAAISCIAGYIKNRKVACLAVAGVMLGLTFLTRPEVFAAALPAAVFGLAMTIRLERPPRRRLAMIVGVSAAAGLAPVLAAFALLRRFMETGAAWRGVLGGWAYIFNQELRGQPYYRSVMGVAGIDDNLLSILKLIGWYGLFLVCIAGLALLFRPGGTYRTWIAGGLFLLPAVIMLRRLAALNLVRPVPVLMLGVAVACFVAYLKPGLKPEARKRMIVRSMLAVFGLGLLAKDSLQGADHTLWFRTSHARRDGFGGGRAGLDPKHDRAPGGFRRGSARGFPGPAAAGGKSGSPKLR